MKLLFHRFCMIFMGYFVILSAFAGQDPNSIDFEDPFYTGILKTTMLEMIDDPNYCIVSIQNEAEKARQKYVEVTAQWCDPNITTSSAYQEAATWILTHLELNEKKWLTFGTAVQMFGMPDHIEFLGFHFNGNDGMDADMERLEAFYPEKGITVEISVMGFVSHVGIINSVIQGRGRFYWPRQFYCAEKLPIISINLIEQQEFNNDRHMELTTFLNGLCVTWKDEIENKWIIAGNTKESLHLQVKLMLLDVIRNDLVGAFYEIKHDDATLYKNVWCFFDGKKWELIKDDELLGLLARNAPKLESPAITKGRYD